VSDQINGKVIYIVHSRVAEDRKRVTVITWAFEDKSNRWQRFERLVWVKSMVSMEIRAPGVARILQTKR
jgi:hypothetical protein